MIREIWQGPRLSGSQRNLLTGFPVWFGLEPGANLSGVYLPFLGPGGGLGLATTFQQANGQYTGAPFIPSADWFQNWITMDPAWVYTDETYWQYWHDFVKSGLSYDAGIAAGNPDLRAFKDAGGKLIMWQGLADQFIFTGDSINYYNQVLRANGGIRNTERFMRYFLAPGVAHCGVPGPGSVAPANPMLLARAFLPDRRSGGDAGLPPGGPPPGTGNHLTRAGGRDRAARPRPRLPRGTGHAEPGERVRAAPAHAAPHGDRGIRPGAGRRAQGVAPPLLARPCFARKPTDLRSVLGTSGPAS